MTRSSPSVKVWCNFDSLWILRNPIEYMNQKEGFRYLWIVQQLKKTPRNRILCSGNAAWIYFSKKKHKWNWYNLYKEHWYMFKFTFSIVLFYIYNLCRQTFAFLMEIFAYITFIYWLMCWQINSTSVPCSIYLLQTHFRWVTGLQLC